MDWIKTSDKLPESDSDYDLYWIVVQWFDDIFDKKFKNHVQCARFSKHQKVWITEEERLIIEDETTTITHWQPQPEPPEIKE